MHLVPLYFAHDCLKNEKNDKGLAKLLKAKFLKTKHTHTLQPTPLKAAKRFTGLILQHNDAKPVFRLLINKDILYYENKQRKILA